MVSEDDNYFSPSKRNGDEYIILDMCVGVGCFNRLRLHDIIDLSKTGNLKIGVRGQSMRVQGNDSSEVMNNIHFAMLE